MLDNWHNFFNAGQFIPHGHCYLWQPGLVRLHVISDAAIALSYFSIPLTLVHLVRKRGDLPFDWVFLLFGSFIIACGTGHLMNIWTLWHPIYWLAGFLNAITAIISACVAVLLVWLIPKILALPSPAQLAAANYQLEIEMKNRLQARAELDRAYQQLTFHVENSPVAVVEWDSEFRVKRWSRQAEKIFGWKATEVLGKHPDEWQLIHPEDAENVSIVMLKLLYASEPRNVSEHRNYTKDGEVIYCEWYNSAFLDKFGNLVSILSLVLDISDRVRAESGLRESEYRYQSLAEASPVGIYHTDLAGNCLYANQRLLEMSGLKKDEILGEGLVNAVHPEDRDRVFQEWYRAAQENLPFKSEYRLLSPDSSTIWVLSQALGQKGASQEITGYIGTISDISDRKLAEEQLVKQQCTLRTILDRAPIWIWMTDLKGQMQFVNKTFCENVGVPESQFLGVPHYSEILGKEESANFMASDVACWSQDAPHHSEETLPFVDGQFHNLEIIKAQIKAESGQVIGLIGLAVDVSERKQVQLALKLSETKFRQLAQHEELLNRLASQIRHSLDLDTILQTAVNEIRNLLQIDRCYFLWYRPETKALAPKSPAGNMSIKATNSDLDTDFVSVNNFPAATDNFLPEGELFTTIDKCFWEVVNEAKSTILESYIGWYSAEQIGSWGDSLLQLRMIRTNDVSTLSEPEMQNFLHSFGMTSLLSLPIQTQSGEIGVLACGHHGGVRVWLDGEVELLQAVTNQLAIALDQAELYNQTRQVAFHAQAQAEKLEQALQQLQKTQSHLIQTEKMSSLGQMVAGVAHEINNPINFIHGNIMYANEYALDLLRLLQLYQNYYPEPHPEIQHEIENMEWEFLSEDLPKLLSSMKIGTDRIRSIVLSLRNFSRLDESEVKKVDIHEGIDSTLLLLQNKLNEKPEELTIEVIKDYGNLPLIECCPGQLNQVFMNLLSNAIDALDEARVKQQEEEKSLILNAQLPTISIRTEVIDNDQISIKIIDNGIGMTEEVRGKLFDPFFTTKEVGKGTGLGLSISYQIVVEEHGGQLYCISAPGQGAEFAIAIPVRSQHSKISSFSAAISEVR